MITAVQQPPAAARSARVGRTQVLFVFPGGRILSPPEFATLRVFAAAGALPRDVVGRSVARRSG